MRVTTASALLALSVVVLPLAARQNVPMNNGTPRAPTGIVVAPLGAGLLTGEDDGAVLRIEPAN